MNNIPNVTDYSLKKNDVTGSYVRVPGKSGLVKSSCGRGLLRKYFQDG